MAAVLSLAITARRRIHHDSDYGNTSIVPLLCANVRLATGGCTGPVSGCSSVLAKCPALAACVLLRTASARVRHTACSLQRRLGSGHDPTVANGWHYGCGFGTMVAIAYGAIVADMLACGSATSVPARRLPVATGTMVPPNSVSKAIASSCCC